MALGRLRRLGEEEVFRAGDEGADEFAFEPQSAGTGGSKSSTAVHRLTGKGLGWWALLDSNQRPTDYESAALTAELRAPKKGKLLNLHALCFPPYPKNMSIHP